jgi:hypothetical protein
VRSVCRTDTRAEHAAEPRWAASTRLGTRVVALMAAAARRLRAKQTRSAMATRHGLR